jgi:streptomycin 6-kinase
MIDEAKLALAEHAERWNVVLENEISETRSGLIGYGTRDGNAVVLKVPMSRTDEAMAAAALKHFGPSSAVKLIECADSGVVLIERAVPGTHLTELVLKGDDRQATQVMCDLMAFMHKPPPASPNFPTVEDWGLGFSRYLATGDKALAPDLVQRARDVFDSLCSTQGARCLLHGDLHHDNVVWDKRSGWRVIDPKGVIGEPAYEAGAALRNPTDDPRWFADESIIEKRIAIFAERLSHDPRRLRAWAYAQAVLSAIWSIEDGEDPERGLATAAALEALLK